SRSSRRVEVHPLSWIMSERFRNTSDIRRNRWLIVIQACYDVVVERFTGIIDGVDVRRLKKQPRTPQRLTCLSLSHASSDCKHKHYPFSISGFLIRQLVRRRHLRYLIE